MKFNIEDYLYQIDQALALKEEREVYLIYAMVAGALIFFSYYFLWDSAKLNYEQGEKREYGTRRQNQSR